MKEFIDNLVNNLAELFGNIWDAILEVSGEVLMVLCILIIVVLTLPFIPLIVLGRAIWELLKKWRKQ